VSRDPLYEFSETTFQKRLAAAIQHSLLPILEYTAEMYEPPPDTFKGELPSVRGYKLKHTVKDYDVESDPILHPILLACRDKNNDDTQVNHTSPLWKSTIEFSVPKQEDHEFWKQSSLDPMKRNVESENSTLLQVFAWGSSDQEARSFAMMKLINLLEFLREILRRWKKTKDMKLLVSEIIGDTPRPSFLDANCKEGLDVDVQLFSFYSRQIHGTRMKDQDWHSISVAIEEYSEKCQAKFQPLLKYYLVPPLSFTP